MIVMRSCLLDVPLTLLLRWFLDCIQIRFNYFKSLGVFARSIWFHRLTVPAAGRVIVSGECGAVSGIVAGVCTALILLSRSQLANQNRDTGEVD